MIHGAHGFLITQFLSPYTNKRNDRFGGSLENRARIALMIVDKVRERVGPDFPIEFRFTVDEMFDGGYRFDEALEFIKMLDGKVDIIHLSIGAFTNWIGATYMFSVFHQHGHVVKYAEAAKKVVKKSYICVVGSINHPELMEEIIASGKADMVAACRTLLADPALPQKARRGQVEDIVPCISCTYCLSNNYPPDVIPFYKGVLHCSVNPLVGHEDYVRTLPAVKEPKRIVIAGGGPAGMKAALTAAERGHQVLLFEKNNYLGGALYHASQPMLKKDLKAFLDYLICQIKKSNIDLRLNCELTPELAAELKPDVIIAACGAKAKQLPIPGADLEHVLLGSELPLFDKIKGDIFIIGAGATGCDEAIELAQAGHKVTVAEMSDKVMNDGAAIYRRGVLKKFEDLDNLQLLLNTTCASITKQGVNLKDGDGNEQFVAANTVIIAGGSASVQDYCEQWMQMVYDFRMIGDCQKPSHVGKAIHDGFFAALQF